MDVYFIGKKIPNHIDLRFIRKIYISNFYGRIIKLESNIMNKFFENIKNNEFNVNFFLYIYDNYQKIILKKKKYLNI